MPIAEFPAIRIDDFTHRPNEPLPYLCFLTHMHEDHTHGLARKSYYGPHVYCTAATRALLLNFRTNSGCGELKYNHLRYEVCGKEIVKALELNRPYELAYLSTSIQVTLIDANHCPGAAMVLIQPKCGEGPSVLFTGDIRCEKWHVDALLHNPAVFPFVKSVKNTRSLSVYVDNTFEAHANPFKPYPENYTGIQSLLKLMDDYPTSIHFCLADRVSGYEEVLIAAAQHLDTLIHMDVYQYNLYMLAADSSPQAAKLLSLSTIELDNASKSVRLHFCQKNTTCPYRDPAAATAYFKPCNQPSQMIVDRQNQIFSRSTVPPGVMIPFSENSQVFKGPDQRYYLDQHADKYFPLFPWFHFSRHASFPEIQQLCAAFNTCSVRSLMGTPLDIPILLDAERSTTSGTEMESGKRVISLIGGAFPHGNEPQLMKRRKIIALHHDRVRQQKARERAQQYKFKCENHSDSEEAGHSSLDTNDEEENHQAMMALGRQNSKHLDREKWHRSFVESERRLNECLADNTEDDADITPDRGTDAKFITGTRASNDADTVYIVHRNTDQTDDPILTNINGSVRKVDSTIEDCKKGNATDGEATLPSPPSTPEPDSLDKVIDDHPTEQESLDVLVGLLKENPQAWFNFSFECMSR